MLWLAEAVEAVEAGNTAHSLEDRHAIIRCLVDQTCSALWTTLEKRSQAKGLVAWLERVRAKGVS